MSFVTIKNHLRNFDKYRKSKMEPLENIFLKAIRNNKICQKELLKAEQVRRILIIRNNTRIGNSLFLIPFIRQVRAIFPSAHITLMIHNEHLGEIFLNLGVDYICYSKLSFKHWIKSILAIIELKKKKFDIIFSPYSSSEDAAICALIPATNKIGRESKTKNNAFSHTFEYTHEKQHAALTSLYLLTKSGFELHPVEHSIELSKEELFRGKSDFCQIKSSKKALYIAYFRGARGAKLLPDSYWLKLIKRVESEVAESIEWVEVLSAEIPKPLVSNVKTFYSPNVRRLASFLTNVDAFICCDTGPLHLADAANVKCIGLYNKTDPITFGLLNKKSICITDIHTFDVKQALGII
ncbi:TPA: glycosyltransferase family 9 protein [Vibrio parahaemolyticus]|nr:glycosyltransferase family 9 protein [Vibrio parahaemolyticus]